MAEAVAERVRRYILDGSDDDLRRLLRIAELNSEHVRAAFRRVGIGRGWSVIDCGCGPIGGLAVMAEMVGPSGRVVGVDSSEPAVQRARSVVATLGLDNVEVVMGDVNAGLARLGGMLDLAYTRCFLMHQGDAVHTLTRIRALLRDGGWILAHEPLRRPPPQSHPHLDALGAYWETMHQVMERSGPARSSAEELARSAGAAGLEVVERRGFFNVIEPELGFGLHASTLAAARERATQLGVATRQEIDDLVSALDAARQQDYEWVSSPFFLDLTLRKPTVPS